MKGLKLIFIGVLSFILLNTITYYAFGEENLRKRNLNEILSNGFENWHEVEWEYVLVSNLDSKKSFTLNDKIYPVFDHEEYSESIGEYADSIFFIKRFRPSKDQIDTLFNVNFDSLYSIDDFSADSLIYTSFESILFSMPDSLDLIPSNGKFDGDCEYYGPSIFVDCIVVGNMIAIPYEDIRIHYPMFIEQEIIAYTYGSDFYGEFRVERLVWILFTWVQVDWVDGNGLNGDKIPSPTRGL